MTRLSLTILITLMIACPTFGQAQSKKPAKKPVKGPLPRVLIIGDQIYNQPSRTLKSVFKGKADVAYATWQPNELPDTTTALKQMNRLLGGKKWDMIHFNFGLADLIHQMSNLKSHRVLPIHAGGVINTSPKQYEKNLRAIVKRLKATNAKLVWASTTPIRASKSNVFKMGTEIEYNAIAEKVMRENKIPINDMYTFITGLINMKKPAGHGADPFNFDKKPIHSPIEKVIRRELQLAAK